MFSYKVWIVVNRVLDKWLLIINTGLIKMYCEGKFKLGSHNTNYCLIEVVTKAGLTSLIEVVTKAGLTVA
jgi:hypothetical protein